LSEFLQRRLLDIILSASIRYQKIEEDQIALSQQRRDSTDWPRCYAFIRHPSSISSLDKTRLDIWTYGFSTDNLSIRGENVQHIAVNDTLVDPEIIDEGTKQVLADLYEWTIPEDDKQLRSIYIEGQGQLIETLAYIAPEKGSHPRIACLPFPGPAPFHIDKFKWINALSQFYDLVVRVVEFCGAGPKSDTDLYENMSIAREVDILKVPLLFTTEELIASTTSCSVEDTVGCKIDIKERFARILREPTFVAFLLAQGRAPVFGFAPLYSQTCKRTIEAQLDSLRRGFDEQEWAPVFVSKEGVTSEAPQDSEWVLWSPTLNATSNEESET